MWVGLGEGVRVGVGGWRRWGAAVMVGQAFLEGAQPVSEGAALLHGDSWVDEGVAKQLTGVLQGSRLLAAC